MEKFYCGSCGYPNSIQNKFCNKCGCLLIKVEDFESSASNNISHSDFIAQRRDELQKEILNLIREGGILSITSSGHRILVYKNLIDSLFYIDLDDASFYDKGELDRLHENGFNVSEGRVIKIFQQVTNDSISELMIDDCMFIFENIFLFENNRPFVFEILKDENEVEEVRPPVTDDKPKNSSLGVVIFVIVLILLIGYYLTTTNKSNNYNYGSSNYTEVSPLSTGTDLKTNYFDVTVNSVRVTNYVNTGNEYTSLKSEGGEKYIVINVTFKNTDKESRTITDGSIHIMFNGQDYNNDKSEVIMEQGWGLFLDQINPLTSKTTNLVYKIAPEITGKAYYNPGRSNENQLIYLGEIR